MKKLFFMALALNFVACSTDNNENNNEITSSPTAEVKESTFNPNPNPEDYRNAKDYNFIQDEKTLAEKGKGSLTGKALELWVRTYVPDSNFRLALINIGAGKEDAVLGDRFIYLDKSRGGLYLPNANITDATGIQAFTSLYQLIISGNKLTYLNVSAITSLSWLECQNNQIAILDLTKNTNLSQIWCHTNQLFSLSLPSAENTLWGVWCYENRLTNLNLNGNNKITSLFIQSNALTTLNTTSLTLLNKTNVSSNRWTTLNFNANSKLTSLWCFSNTLLTDLSIKNNNNVAIVNQDFRFNTKAPKIHVDASFLPKANTSWGLRGSSIYQL